MIALSYKSTHYATIALKVLVLGLTAWYLGHTFGQMNTLSWASFSESWTKIGLLGLMAVGTLSALNWITEIRKWQLLASYVRATNYRRAAVQSLVSFCLSIATPKEQYG